MKKLIFTFVTLFVVAGYTQAQQANQVLIQVGKESIKEKINAGSLEVFFNVNKNATEIRTTANYYVSYFKVNYDEKTGRAMITFIDQSQMSRKVVERFLISNQITEVVINGKPMPVQNFMDQFLN
jgi:regulatory protein YycI of two-component signal transduction system YycFG